MSTNIKELERDVFFASLRLELNRASLRFGDKEIVDFLAHIISDFNCNAYVAFDDLDD